MAVQGLSRKVQQVHYMLLFGVLPCCCCLELALYFRTRLVGGKTKVACDIGNLKFDARVCKRARACMCVCERERERGRGEEGGRGREREREREGGRKRERGGREGGIECWTGQVRDRDGDPVLDRPGERQK